MCRWISGSRRTSETTVQNSLAAHADIYSTVNKVRKADNISWCCHGVMSFPSCVAKDVGIISRQQYAYNVLEAHN